METVAITVGEREERILPFVGINKQHIDVLIEARLIGEGANLVIVGIFFGSKDSHFTFNTKVIHQARNTKSLTTIRGVFLENSSFHNDGLVTIQKGAKGSDGYFSSKVLLFGNAKGRSVPSLEIDENDLKAGHASTVGRPDPMQLLYLKSRGLAEREATNLIISGFFAPALKLLPVKETVNIQRKLEKYITGINI
jgi:Fe-S cluster assembly protein SufD